MLYINLQVAENNETQNIPQKSIPTKMYVNFSACCKIEIRGSDDTAAERYDIIVRLKFP